MKIVKVNRREIPYFGGLANQINDNQEALASYIQNPFSLENFEKQIELKKEAFSADTRKVLHKELTEQLSSFYSNYSKVKENVDALLDENTFTVIAGHQLNLYGGPLYTVYKIMDAIRLAEELNKKYPNSKVVPVFWMGSEDHDFEEINHIHLFGNKIAWESEQKGPTGRFSLDGFDVFKLEITDKFQNNEEFANYIGGFYQNGSLATSTIEFYMDLFGDYGLVILDSDRAALKKEFLPLIKKELTEQFSEKAIEETTKQLEEEGFHGQAFARPINLFYIKDQFRERIIPLENGNFEIDEKEIVREELLQELETNPERFSPNVVLRPLYQECILPNLCYLGGGGEMAYWLQLKRMFDEAEMVYPIIKVRNSLQWMDKTTANRIEKLEFDLPVIFEDIDEVKKQFVFENAEEELDFSELDKVQEAFTAELETSILAVEQGLDGMARSEIVRIEKQIDVVKQKLIRQQKKKHEDVMKQIDGVFSRMLPENGLQERYENVIPYLAKFGTKEYMEILHKAIDPFGTELILVVEE